MVLARLSKSSELAPALPGQLGGVAKLHRETMAPSTAAIPAESCPDPYPSSLCPEISQLNFSLQVRGTFQAAVPLLLPRVIEFMSLGRQQPLVSVFTARQCGDSFSWHQRPGLGSPAWGWEPLLLSRDLLRYASQVPVSCLHSPSCMSSLYPQLQNFCQCSDGSQWWLLYNLVVVRGKDEHSISLLHHRDQKSSEQ